MAVVEFPHPSGPGERELAQLAGLASHLTPEQRALLTAIAAAVAQLVASGQVSAGLRLIEDLEPFIRG